MIHRKNKRAENLQTSPLFLSSMEIARSLRFFIDLILYGFEVDQVGISALAVGRSARNDDRVAFFYKSRIARGALGKVEENVHRIVFFAEDGIDAPAERKFLIGTRVRRHTDNVDHGAKAGDHLCGAARAGAYDDRFCVDVARQKTSRMGERVRKIADQIFVLVYFLNKFRFRLRLTGDARHCRDCLNGVRARRRLAGEHDRARTVVNGVGNVGNFRSRGAGIFDHGFEHLGRRDTALACDTAGVDDRLLNVGQFLVGDLHAHVSAPDHNAVGHVEDFLQIIHARAVFNFGDEVDVRRAVLAQKVPHVENVLRFGNERTSHEIDLLFDPE